MLQSDYGTEGGTTAHREGHWGECLHSSVDHNSEGSATSPSQSEEKIRVRASVGFHMFSCRCDYFEFDLVQVHKELRVHY